MTAKEIAHLIESPETCTTAHISELESLSAKYPYAQTFPILLLRQLAKSEALGFDEQLKKYAFKVSDRSHLYFQVNDKNKETQQEKSEVIFVQEPAQEENPVEETPILSIVPEEEKIEVQDVAEEILTPLVETNDITSDAPEYRGEVEIDPNEDLKDFRVVEVEEMTFEPVTIDFAEEDLIALNLDTPEEESSEVNIEVNEQIEKVEEDVIEPSISEIEEEVIELDSEVVQDAIVEESSQEVIAEVIPELPEENAVLDEIIEEEVNALEFMPLETFDPTVEIREEIIEKEEALEYEETLPSSFEAEKKAISFDILTTEDPEMDEVTSHAIAAGYQVTLAEVEVEEEKIIEDEISESPTENYLDEEIKSGNKLLDEKRSFTDWLKVSAKTNSPEYQVKQQRAEEILDKFIKEDPKITRFGKEEIPEKKVAEFFKVSTIAKESLNEDLMPVSETLTQIYVNQGNFGKAIDAYQQLILLFPEKKSFFADQIKKLKKKIKS